MSTTIPTRTRAAVRLAAALCGIGLLAGCAAGEAAETEDAAVDDTTAAVEDPAGAEGAQAPEGFDGPSGITGEIAYVADGVAQVQDGDSQTAVRFTDATAITQEVEIALEDIEAGTCVVVTLGDDEIATAVSTADADEDGTCSLGFGGGFGGQMPEGEMPGGEMPEGGELPEGGERPEGAMPDGEMPGGEMAEGEMPEGGFAEGGFGQILAGAVTAVGADELTVEDADGETTVVALAEDATITGTVDATADDVQVGLCLTAAGEEDGSGGYDATEISLSSAGDEGCYAVGGFGGMGRGGQGGFGGEGGPGDAGDLDSMTESDE